MTVSLIVAVASNGVIGRDGGLPWRLPADLAHFKKVTMGHHLVVGRKTWESIGRPLPGRRMVVLSRGTPALPPGVRSAASLDEALAAARAEGDDEAFVAGGASIYALALPLADRIYWTEIHAEAAGEVRFPAFDPSDWNEIERSEGVVDERNSVPHAFVVYERAAAR